MPKATPVIYSVFTVPCSNRGTKYQGVAVAPGVTVTGEKDCSGQIYICFRDSSAPRLALNASLVSAMDDSTRVPQGYLKITQV